MSRVSPSYVTGLEKYINELRNQVSSLKAELRTIRRIHAQNIALKDAEIARWKTVPMKYRRMEFNAKLQAENAALKEQVAQLELEVAQMREALETFIAEHEECEDGDGWMAQMCSMEALHVADEAMSTPFTTTALHELIEKVEKMTIERCADHVFAMLQGTKYDNAWAELHDAQTEIRALPLEHIKLEELP